MVRDLDLGLKIVACSTIRQVDGLALSSRNSRLSTEQMKAATVVYRSLRRAEDLWRSGQRDAGVLREEVRVILEQESLVDGVDYVSVAASETLDELEAGQDDVIEASMVSVAVRFGEVRLIDNIILESD